MFPCQRARFRHARTAGLLAGLTLLLAGAATIAAPRPAAALTTTVTTLAPRYQAITPGTARLTTRVTAGGRALAGVPVNLLIRRTPEHAWTVLRRLTTDSSGYARHAFGAWGSLQVQARFPGDATRARSNSSIGTVTPKPFGVRVLEEAARHRGKPYQWGAVGPDRFDCSGFTRYVFGRFGRSLPHNSGQQYGSVRHVDRSAKRPGDLIFTYSGGRISHVAIFAGYADGAVLIWDASRSGSYVSRRRLWTTSYSVGRVG